MKKSTVISIIALIISITSILIALIAYFKKRHYTPLSDNGEDDMMDLDFDEDDDDSLSFESHYVDGHPEDADEAEEPVSLSESRPPLHEIPSDNADDED